MNGLAFIRRQCNLSQEDIAGNIQISLESIVQHEKGEESLKESEMEKLEAFLGVEREFFFDLSESQKDKLLEKKLFRYFNAGHEFYLYRYDPLNAVKERAYSIPERSLSLDAELMQAKQQTEELLQKIENLIAGPELKCVEDQLKYYYRGMEVFKEVCEGFSSCFEHPSKDKMLFYNDFFNQLRMLSKKMKAERPSKEAREISAGKIAAAQEAQCMRGTVN